MAKVLQWVGIDEAVGYTLITRGWSMFAGVCNIVLISHFLTGAEQGYFYTFASLVAVQIVFELGFSFVVLQSASHERAMLSQFDNRGVAGSAIAHARLASLLQATVRWYSRSAILMGIVLAAVGIRFFHSYAGDRSVHWMLPWCLDAFATAAAFLVDPIVCFLEGSGWVVQVARLRLPQALLGSLLGWLALLAHHGLYAPALMILGQAAAAYYFVLVSHRPLLSGLLHHQVGSHGIRWREEIWPFQWRIAVTWASTYFIFQCFNPVLFAYTGPVVAGRMGMSLNICASLTALAQAWINTKAPRFGMLVATQQRDRLGTEFTSVTVQSAGMLLMASCLVLLTLSFAEMRYPAVAQRVVGVPTFALLLATVFISHFVTCQSYYLRAHKEEPFLWLWVGVALLSVVSVIWAAKHAGAFGVALAYFLTGGFFRVVAGTYIFTRKRRQWDELPVAALGVVSPISTTQVGL